MRRIVVIIGIFVLGLAIAGYVFFNGERKVPVRYRTVPVERGTIVSLVTARGRSILSPRFRSGVRSRA